ncbi:MAG TPA: transmembrane 220 family protein [Longimicrobium sp.]|nr:transmembrane 220 family protein [Longimicrobium sp.]
MADPTTFPASNVLRAANGAMAALFAFAAAVQYNDPDPLRWMALYLAAAAACVLAFLRRLPRWAPLVVGLAALAWAATLAPHVLGRVGWGEMVEAWEMKDVRVEEGRETYGLLIVAAWMAVLAVAHRRLRHPNRQRLG